MDDASADTSVDPADAPSPASGASGADGATTTQPDRSSGKALLVVFWLWAALLAVITIAQIFGLDGVLDVLDVKRWFTR